MQRTALRYVTPFGLCAYLNSFANISCGRHVIRNDFSKPNCFRGRS